MVIFSVSVLTLLEFNRFVRDYMRYRDNIQCAGAELVNLVRNDARKLFPKNKKGTYYALHIRRGDFQYKVGNYLSFLAMWLRVFWLVCRM
jgi:hypothetical protein